MQRHLSQVARHFVRGMDNVLHAGPWRHLLPAVGIEPFHVTEDLPRFLKMLPSVHGHH
jgi:hypothetical protein